jgi:membrane fusion protein (multidrug efflux system)
VIRLRPAAPVAILLFLGCGGDKGEEKAVQAVVSAKTAKAELKSFAQTVSAMGVVEARPGTFAALGAAGPTRVAKVFVTAGQRVEKGTPLVEFERAPFEAAAKGAETGLSAARQSRDRIARLVEAGVAPRKDLDAAETELAQAETNAITARRVLELATLTAPISGVVTRMTAVVGAPADATQLVVEVADPSALDVVFNLSPGDAALVHSGQGAAFTAGEGDKGESLGTGTVTSVGLAIDSVTRSVAVRAAITRPARALRIGETVYGHITVATHGEAVVIPAEALVPEGEGYKVFVVDSTGTAMGREVKIGGRTEGLAEIAEGVSAGETVVTYGAYGIEDSTRIAPQRP